MKIELWSYSEDEYGFLIEDDNLKQRVYLENHALIEGVDASEVDLLNEIYSKEQLKKNDNLDNMDYLLYLSRNWFSVTSYFNRYIELSDCIVFNHNINKFESFIDTYSNIAERYIESYDEDGNPITLGEFEFPIRKKLEIEEGVEIKSETFKVEYLFRINETDNYLYKKSDLLTGNSKGIILNESAVNSLLKNNTDLNILKANT